MDQQVCLSELIFFVDTFSFKPLPDKDNEHVLVQFKRQVIHLQVDLM